MGEVTVHYTILDETGPNDILLFGCGHPECQEKKMTSHQLETHMRTRHEATKFTVALSSVNRNQDRRETRRPDGDRRNRDTQAPRIRPESNRTTS